MKNKKKEHLYKISQTNYAKTNNIYFNKKIVNDKISIYKLLEKIKNGKNKFEEWQKENYVNINNIRDKNGNNILHLISLLKKDKKCKYLDTLIKIYTINNQKDLEQLINSKNLEGKTPLQLALINKIKRKKHKSNTINFNDSTLNFLIKLLNYGADPNNLKLHKKEFRILDEKQKIYYYKFSKKIIKSIKKSDLFIEKVKNSLKNKGSEIIYNDYQLRKTILESNKEKFNKILQNGYNISNKSKDGNTLHFIITKLKKKERLKFLNILLNNVQKEEFIKAVNDKNAVSKNNSQTPLHQLLNYIEKKSKSPSLKKRIENIIKKDFRNTNRYKILELLLINGANINIKDKKGNNAIHYISLFKGEQKIICFKLILSLLEKKNISENQLINALNSLNKDGKTPLQIALIKKAEKGKHLLERKKILDSRIVNYNNTTKFCAELLKNGTNPSFLNLKEKKFHTDKYYLVLRDLKNYSKILYTVQKKAKENKEYLEKKYNIKTFPKQLQNDVKNFCSNVREAVYNTEKTLSSIVKYIDPVNRTRELLIITLTVAIITMAVFAFFQGKVKINGIVPIILSSIIMYTILTFGFNNIKKSIKNFNYRIFNTIENDKKNSKDYIEKKNILKKYNEEKINTKIYNPSIKKVIEELENNKQLIFN